LNSFGRVQVLFLLLLLLLLLLLFMMLKTRIGGVGKMDQKGRRKVVGGTA